MWRSRNWHRMAGITGNNVMWCLWQTKGWIFCHSFLKNSIERKGGSFKGTLGSVARRKGPYAVVDCIVDAMQTATVHSLCDSGMSQHTNQTRASCRDFTKVVSGSHKSMMPSEPGGVAILFPPLAHYFLIPVLNYFSQRSRGTQFFTLPLRAQPSRRELTCPAMK